MLICAPNLASSETPKVDGTPIAERALPLTKARRIFDKGPHMVQMVHKRSEDTLDYFIDLERWLEPDEDITGCRAWAITSALKITKLNFAATGVVVWLSSGGNAKRHEVRCQVVTSLGKVKLFRFIVITTGGDEDEIIVLPSITIGSVTVELAEGGGGPDPEAPTITLSASSLAFGTVEVGEAGIAYVEITNTGDSDVIISGVNVAGAGFSLTGSEIL